MRIHLETVKSVFELVIHANYLTRELAGFADRQEGQAEPRRNCCSENEPACLHSGDGLGPAHLIRQPFDRRGKPPPVTEQSRNIAKLDALFRKVGNGPDQGFQVGGRHIVSPGIESAPCIDVTQLLS